MTTSGTRKWYFCLLREFEHCNEILACNYETVETYLDLSLTGSRTGVEASLDIVGKTGVERNSEIGYNLSDQEVSSSETSDMGENRKSISGYAF